MAVEQSMPETGQRPIGVLAITDEEEDRVAKIAKTVNDAIQSLGDGNNQLALQLQNFQIALVDPGPGWEAEKARLESELLHNVQIASDFQLMASRIGQEAALQVDTVRKSNAILESQVKYLIGVIAKQNSDIEANAREAQRMETAYRNQMHVVLGKASELSKLSALRNIVIRNLFLFSKRRRSRCRSCQP